jgi:hypothetical protein
MAFLNYDGLLYFWQKIKALLAGKVDKIDGKGLSTNDFTTAEKNKLAGLKNYTHPTTSGNKHIPAGGSANQILGWSADGTAKWVNEKDTTYTNFKGATADTAGSSGLVNAPAKGQQGLYLRGDGTWATPTNTTYNDVTQSAHGLMTAADKKKLDGIATGANKYVHPSYTAHDSGLYKITVDATGHVSAVTAVAKGDITALGIPSTNTTYNDATQSTHGLMSIADKKKLDAFGEASTYALKSDITAMYRYKGSVASYDKLPTSGQIIGDVYDVGNGMNYAWNGEKWDELGQVFTIDAIQNTEIDTILAS